MKRIPFTPQTFFPSDIQSYLELPGDQRDTGTHTGTGDDTQSPAKGIGVTLARPATEAHMSALLAGPIAQMRAHAAALTDAALGAALESAAASRAAATSDADKVAPLPETEQVRQLLDFVIHAVEAGPLHLAAFSSEARIWISTNICGNTATISAWQNLLAELRKVAATTLDAHTYPIFHQRLKEAQHILELSRASLETERHATEIAAGAAAAFIRLHNANLNTDAPPVPEAETEAAPSFPTITEEDARTLSELFLHQLVQIIALGSDAEIRLNLTRCATEIFASQLDGTPKEWHYLLGTLQLHIEDTIGPIAAAPLQPYFQLLSEARFGLGSTGAITRRIEAVAETLEKQIAELFPVESDLEDTEEETNSEDDSEADTDPNVETATETLIETSLPWREILSLLVSDVSLKDNGKSAPCLPWLVQQNSPLLSSVSAEKFEAFADIVLTTLKTETDSEENDGMALLEKAFSKTAAAIAFVQEEESYGTARVQAVVNGAATHLRQGLEVFNTVEDLEKDLAYALHTAQRTALLHGSDCAARTAFRHWFLLLHSPTGHWRHARTIVSALHTQIRQDWSHRGYWQQHPAAGPAGAAGKLLEDLPSAIAAAELAAAASTSTATTASGSSSSQKIALDAYPFGITPRASTSLALEELFPLPCSRQSTASAPFSKTCLGKGLAQNLGPDLQVSAGSKDPSFDCFRALLAELAPVAVLKAGIWAYSDEIAKTVAASLSYNFPELRSAAQTGNLETADVPATAFRRDVARLLRRLAQSLSPDVESRAEYLNTEWTSLVEPHMTPRPRGIFRALATQLTEAIQVKFGSQAEPVVEPLLRPLLFTLRTDTPAGEIAPIPFVPLRATFPLFEELKRHPVPAWSAPTGSPFPDLAEFWRQHSPTALTYAVAQESEEHRAESTSFLEANFPFLATVLPRGIAHFEWAGFLSLEITKAWHDLAAVTPAGNVMDRFLTGLILGAATLPSITDRLRLIAYLQAYRHFHRQSVAATELHSRAEELAEYALSDLTAPGLDIDYLRTAVTEYIRGVADIFAKTDEFIACLEARRLAIEKLLPRSKFPPHTASRLLGAVKANLEDLNMAPATRSTLTGWFADLLRAAYALDGLQPAARTIFASHHKAGTQPLFSPRPVEEAAWQQILSSLMALHCLLARDNVKSVKLHLVVAASLPLAGEITLKDLPELLNRMRPRVQQWMDEYPSNISLHRTFEQFQTALATFADWKKIVGALPETLTALKEKETPLNRLTEGNVAIANLLLVLMRNAAIPPILSRLNSCSKHRLLGGETAALLAGFSKEDADLLQHAISKAVSTEVGNALPSLCALHAKAEDLREIWDSTWAMSIDDLRLFTMTNLLTKNR